MSVLICCDVQPWSENSRDLVWSNLVTLIWSFKVMDGGKCADSMVTLWLAHKGQMDFLLSSDYLITVNMRDGKTDRSYSLYVFSLTCFCDTFMGGWTLLVYTNFVCKMIMINYNQYNLMFGHLVPLVFFLFLYYLCPFRHKINIPKWWEDISL